MPKINNSMATKNDLKKLKQDLQLDLKKIDKRVDVLDQKVEKLDKKVDGVERSLRAEIQLSAKELEEKLDKKAKQYRDQILTKMDKFLVEINAS